MLVSVAVTVAGSRRRTGSRPAAPALDLILFRKHLFLALIGMALALPCDVSAQEAETGHMHGPDGRHIAVAETFGATTGKSVLSHHDLKITDTSKFSLKKDEGALVEGCDVHSIIHKKGDPKAVAHREHNTYEPENGVYGSHMMYREPGEYVIIENVTMPGGKNYVLEFPIWVPATSGGKPEIAPSPLLVGLGAMGALAVIAAAYVLGRRSGRRAAAGLSSLALLLGVLPFSGAVAQDEETGHMHGPDGRHIAVAETFGTRPGDPLKAFLGPNREIEAFQTKDNYRFRLSIENEEMAPPDPDVVSLSAAAAAAVGVEVVPVRSRPLGGGISAVGLVRPNPNGEVTVNSTVRGRVLRMNVNPGQQISRGQVVAVIESTEIAEAGASLSRAESQQRQSDAAHASARAEVRRMLSLVEESSAGLARSQAQLAEAGAEVERARSELEISRGKVESARKTVARQQQLVAAGAFAQGPVEIARAAVAAAEGELREAQTALANYEAQARRMEQGFKDGVVARRDLETAQTAAMQGRSRAATAERQLQIVRATMSREERILRENLRDNREVETARAEFEAAELGVRSAMAAVVRQQRSVDAAEALVTAQRRALESAQSQVESARSEEKEAAAAAGSRQAVRSSRNLLRVLGASSGGGSQLAVAAPIAGEVASRPVTAGQVVEPGEALATLLNTQSVWVESDVFEKDLPRIRLGQRIAIGADAVPGRTFEGTISYIGSEVNAETRAVRVRTVVRNPDKILKPNMFVRAIIASGSGAALSVPLEAVQEQAGEQVVFVAESAESYRRRVVRLGPTLGDQVTIEAGLKPGERVVTRGSYQLLAKARK